MLRRLQCKLCTFAYSRSSQDFLKQIPGLHSQSLWDCCSHEWHIASCALQNRFPPNRLVFSADNYYHTINQMWTRFSYLLAHTDRSRRIVLDPLNRSDNSVLIQSRIDLSESSEIQLVVIRRRTTRSTRFAVLVVFDVSSINHDRVSYCWLHKRADLVGLCTFFVFCTTWKKFLSTDVTCQVVRMKIHKMKCWCWRAERVYQFFSKVMHLLFASESSIHTEQTTAKRDYELISVGRNH